MRGRCRWNKTRSADSKVQNLGNSAGSYNEQRFFLARVSGGYGNSSIRIGGSPMVKTPKGYNNEIYGMKATPDH